MTARLSLPLAVAACLVLAAPGLAHAQERQAGPTPGVFATIHKSAFAGQAIAAVDAQSVVVGGVSQAAGSQGEAVVEARVDGRWVTQRLGVQAAEVHVVADGGVAWVLTVPAMGAGEATLWHSQGARLVRVPLPTLPSGFHSWRFTGLAAEGGAVVVTTHAQTGPSFYDPSYAQVATRRGGVWTVRSAGLPDHVFAAKPRVTQGHVLVEAETYGERGVTRIHDVTAEPSALLGTADDFPARTRYNGNAFVALAPRDAVVWGSQTSDTGVVSGYCKRLVNGSTAACPAPDGTVVAAELTIDDRALLGGFATGKDGNLTTQLSLVDTAGALVPLGRAATGGVRDVATAPVGSRAWALVDPQMRGEGGLPSTPTLVQEATLPAR